MNDFEVVVEVDAMVMDVCCVAKGGLMGALGHGEGAAPLRDASDFNV